MKRLLVILAVGLLPMAAFAQTTPAAQAAQSASAPSFDETVTWLQGKVSTAGFDYSEQTFTTVPSLGNLGNTTGDPGSVRWTYENFRGNSCHLYYLPVYKPTGDETEITPFPIDVDLSKLTQGFVKVKTYDPYPPENRQGQSKHGTPTYWTITVTEGAPQYWAVSLGTGAPAATYNDYDSQNVLVWPDQDTATRVAKALNHLIDLCGGAAAKPELF